MTKDRTIPPRPTTYRGRLFRSRLEAKWAAFFDLLGWPWEYEPEAIGSWMPDFVVGGPDGRIFVEVKPAHLASGAERKVAAAIDRLGRRRFGLVVGEAPAFRDGRVLIGRAYGEEEPIEPDEQPVLRWGMAHLVTERKGHPLTYDLICEDLEDGCLLARGNETSGNVIQCYKEVLRLWHEAANRVMWQPPAG
jgi:hypothetical protein